MPELPEVETTKRGIAPYSEGRTLKNMTIRNGRLRWPVDVSLPRKLQGLKLQGLERRGKYLLMSFESGTLLVHLGMSGSLRVVEARAVVGKHDHIDMAFSGGHILRFNDPRRFGAFVWHEGGDVGSHALLHHLGPEPLSDEFSAEYLVAKSKGRLVPLKSFVMDSKIVVGVGNIYANEALYSAGIHPLKAASKLSRPKARILVDEIKQVLQRSITQGGTTLRDFVGGDGKPGYFAQQLNVYGRGGEPCRNCSKVLTEKRLQNRTTVYCTACQK